MLFCLKKYHVPGLFWARERLLISVTSEEMKIAVIFKLEVPTYCVYFSSSLVSLFLAAVDGGSGEFPDLVICPESAEHLIPCIQGIVVFSGPKATEMQEFVKCVQ